ncbi:chemotaxis protein CheB [Granulicella mallensis]|uniref:histidine kinase n=1 Tax=Granulicella mallensis (strain ATCC BAA-1857 / DSM 23137 / MP5ACTX8) TaxID=682795 RepID=G8NTF9_GRAMM|nr:chemotaxis protein CheB [Granulicella mallensis]AEU35191.1 signal transduction histidine kinase with CheB and CheR activity [Granulicella mallensis MP5ACTX8]
MPSSPVQRPPPKKTSLEIPVVAIGASAGGLEALTAILRALPTDIAMAFMLIQHLDPKRHSILPELLSRATRIPVLEAVDAMKVESNHVYVMPSNVDISITDGHFGLAPRAADHKQHLPIDIFMRSLAEVRKSKAIGVILSGTGSDGTAGIKAIRAEGGVTFAQSTETAKFDGMPRSAIESGCIDYVLSPEKIAAELAHLSSHPQVRQRPKVAREEPKSDSDVFDSILNLVSISQGSDFTKYKPNTIHRRIQQRMAALRILSLSAYLTYLREHPEEVAKLSHHVLIPVTEFFRNPETFEDLAKTVFPAMIEEKAGEALRLWVVACSTGEEVYSLAITLLEFLGTRAEGMRIQIFGTDINEKGIAKARSGIYSESAMKNVSAERTANFFTKVAGGYRANKVIRDLCVFARQDVTKDPPFSSLDLISCRNFLIYVEPELQERIISTLHYALNPSGFLLLGNAESAASYPQMFTPLNKKSKIYSKKVGDHRQQRTFKTSRAPLQAIDSPIEKALPISRASQNEQELQQLADRMVLRECAPPGVIVNDALEILQFRGRTSPYLEPASGRANLNILNMVREELAIALRTAIASARKKAAPIKKKNVAFEHNGKKRVVHLSVVPMDELVSGVGRCYLILFEDVASLIDPNGKADRPLPLQPGDLSRRTLLDQKRELQATRTLLKEHTRAQEALREDYQSANEEMLSANEELQSTNEELETSKEELQATNEELNTVNDELNSNNAALHLLGNDLKNLLESTVIPIVMVDGNLCIRRMTPTAEAVFKVLPSDIGRPITDINPDLNIDLKPLLTTVLRDVVSLEREVQDQQGHWYRLQVRPYETLDNRSDGAVLVLMDIDVIKKRNQELVLASEFTKSIIETMPEPVLVLNANLHVLMANYSFYKAFEVTPEATLNRFVYGLGNGQWNKPDLRTLLEEVLPHDRDFLNHEVIYDFPGIGWKSFMLSGRYMVQEPEAAPLILLSLTDMTKRKKIEAALVQAEKLTIASRLAATIAHEINNPLEAITNLLYLASTGDDAAAAKTYAAQALEEVGRVSHITQQTLKFYRQSTAPSSVQVSEILDSLLVLYHGKLLANNITVHRQYREGPSILCLAGDLRQIFANLLSNAVDAMRFGGSLTMRVSSSYDWRNQERRGIRATISDSGTGMTPKTLRKIYEPFFTTKNETGTGLGMWVSAQLVDRLQGDLRVSSTMRRGRSGTTFSLFLPLELSA